jgi:proliferating cell nuclear antigen
MKLVITEPKKVKAFATIFKQLKNVTADVNIDFTEDTMYIQGMDSAQACLFELLLQKSWFEEFTVKQPFSMGIHCEFMFKMIECLEDGQKITMHMKETSDRLSVDFDSIEDNNTIRKCFEMPLMNIDSEHLQVPETEHEADISILSDEFADLIGQLSIFGDDLQVVCNMETINLTANGEMGKMTAAIKEENIVEYAIEENILVNLTISIKFIQTMCGFAKISDVAYLHCSNNRPVKLHYSLDDEDSADSCNYVRFFVAPKLDD